jgi:carbon starvation protein CstA
MLTFITSMILLVLGYVIYVRFIDKTFQPNENKETPAHTMEDGVDYEVERC